MFQETRGLQDKRDAFRSSLVQLQRLDAVDLKTKVASNINVLKELLRKMKLCFQVFKDNKKSHDRAEDAYSKCSRYLNVLEKKEKAFLKSERISIGIGETQEAERTTKILSEDFELNSTEESLLNNWQEAMLDIVK